MKLKYVVEKEMMVKEYLIYLGISHHLRKKVRALDNIYINGIHSKNYFMLKVGDVLELEFPEELNDEYEANFNDLDLITRLYEDEYLMVISKPVDIASQVTRKHPLDNVLSIVKAYYINNNIKSNIHLVNRLDYSTSGLMIIAKSNICHNELSKIDIEKYYLCLVHGHLQEKEMLIEKNIKRENPPSILRYIDKDGQVAKTIVKEIKRYEDKSLVEAKLITGRCHQIRLHLASIGNPIVGDKLYGKAEDERLCLHAYHLKFIHPFTSNVIDIYDYPDFE